VGVTDDQVAKVRQATNIVVLIGERVALRRVGTRLVGRCPFHPEESPSFSVNPSEGLYYCFGCQTRGDVITFVRETHNLDLEGSVRYLAARVGIALD